MSQKKAGTTDDFDPLAFRPHGRVTFTIDDNVLICDAVGPFNKELIEAIEAVEIDLIHEIKENEKWGDIVVISGSALGSEATLEAFTAYLKKLVALGLVSNVTALALSDTVEGASIMKPRLIQAYAEAGIPLTVFPKVNEAMVWVKLHL